MVTQDSDAYPTSGSAPPTPSGYNRSSRTNAELYMKRQGFRSSGPVVVGTALISLDVIVQDHSAKAHQWAGGTCDTSVRAVDSITPSQRDRALEALLCEMRGFYLAMDLNDGERPPVFVGQTPSLGRLFRTGNK